MVGKVPSRTMSGVARLEAPSRLAAELPGVAGVGQKHQFDVVAVGQIMTRMYAGNRWPSRRLINALAFSMALLIAPLAFTSTARSQAVGYPSGSQPAFPSD